MLIFDVEWTFRCNILTKFQGNYEKIKILRKLIGTIFEIRGAFQKEYPIPCKLATLQRSAMKLGEIKIFEFCIHCRNFKSLASVRSEHADCEYGPSYTNFVLKLATWNFYSVCGHSNFHFRFFVRSSSFWFPMRGLHFWFGVKWGTHVSFPIF